MWLHLGLFFLFAIIFLITTFFMGLSSRNNDVLLNENFVLTFDDGPHPENTLKIAQICKSENVPAIFFFLGEEAQKYPNIVKTVSDMGFEIGTHGMTHVRHDTKSYGFNYDSLSRSKKIIENIIGKPIKRFRPPYGGRYVATMMAETATGLQHTGWSSCIDDWKDISEDAQISGALSTLNKGGIILAHDVRDKTVNILPRLISECRAKLN